MSKTSRRTSSVRLLHSLCAAVSAIGATQVAAQAVPAPSGGVADAATGEILVTARKRNESTVDVPDSVTVFSAQQIQDAGLHDIRDFANLTPNLNITSGQGINYPAILVRGLAQAQTGEAPVAVVVDGVQLADPAFITQDYGDVEQIEVLRGPQGSLYGRNAIGGAINIVTKQPTNDTTGRVRASYGNGDTVVTNAEVSGPLVADKILFRVAGNYRRTDGLIENIFLNEPADFGHSAFVHGRLIFNLSDDFKLDLRANYGHDRVGNPTAEIVSNAQFDDFKPGFIQSNKPVVETRTVYDFSGKIDYSGNYLMATSITGYSRVKGANIGDADFTSAPIVLVNNTRKVRAFTEELRLSSPGSERFRWLVGAFYQDRHTDNSLIVPLDDGTGEPTSILVQNSQDIGTSKSWAVFGSASYDIIRQVELTLGGRYDSDKRTSVDEVQAGSDTSHTFTSFQPKVQIAYKPTKGMNIYATYGKGFGSGGFNAFVSTAQSRLYNAQTAENVEVGFKGGLADNRITFSVAAFRVEYKNQQFFFVNYSPPTQNISNIDKTRVNGVEAEVNGRISRHFTLSSGFGYSDAKIRAYAALPLTRGNRSPQNPKYTFNVAGQYSITVGNDLDLRAYASYRRQGSEYWDAQNIVRTPAKDFVNGRLFFETSRWSLGGFVNNLTNTQYPTLAAIGAVGPNGNLRVPSPKRSYGVEGSFKF